ncbi:S1 family peptidase [Bdellovibrio reynosensis]|uniref:Trypsin-like serine protease n=1 Tax=Bdellovibrio reynosensis TaxID=2835041 RepID=A0ABY4CB91_9BACT|nr:trypsin-like serine protease [Bdellovibrio reynosensis]UOF00778.1 trypsin-like serine protease [Bdellovibrio reynosensis]
MKRNKLFLAGLFSSLALTACAPQNQNPTSNLIETADSAIIGGSVVQAGDKITESIVAVYDAAEGQLCTGSLLPNNLVLTAAHCVGAYTEEMYVFFDLSLSATSERRKVDKLEVSPYWPSRQLKEKNTGDIAILHFTGTVPAGYKPATFLAASQKSLLKRGSTVVLAGYGITNGVTGEGAGTLKMTSVKVEDPLYSVSEVKLNQTQGTGACHGDSGGPAYVEVKGKYYLWGVTSRGVNDEDNDCSKYSAYTSALYYKVWINRMAQKLSVSLTAPQVSK